MMSSPYMKWAEKVMVALDYPTPEAAEQLLDELKGYPCYMKVGMQLYYAAGPTFVEMLKKRGYKVFLDLKLHDIPNTVRGAAASITRLGVDMFNVHAAGGVQMMRAAIDGAQSESSASTAPSVIAVTQLTSTSEAVMNDEIGLSGTIESVVSHYGDLAKNAGLAGVVASPREVVMLKQQQGEDFITVTPGIRPNGADIGDQHRVMTPLEAIRQGTDYLVIGRAITASQNPAAVLEQILKEMSEA